MTDLTQPATGLASQLHALERRVRRLQSVLFAGALAVGILGATAFTRQGARSAGDVISARRLVLVDDQGRPGATIELGRVAAPADGKTPDAPDDRSLRITVSDAGGHVPDQGLDTAHGGRGAQHAELTLNPERLSITFDTKDTQSGTHTSGVGVNAKPTLVLTRDGQSVYLIDPIGGLRPVLSDGR
jgi:hypothetical protein